MNLEKPVLSPDFTIEDIHKLREYNYYNTKDMSLEEKVQYYNSGGKEAEREIERLRSTQSCNNVVCKHRKGRYYA